MSIRNNLLSKNNINNLSNIFLDKLGITKTESLLNRTRIFIKKIMEKTIGELIINKGDKFKDIIKLANDKVLDEAIVLYNEKSIIDPKKGEKNSNIENIIKSEHYLIKLKDNTRKLSIKFLKKLNMKLDNKSITISEDFIKAVIKENLFESDFRIRDDKEYYNFCNRILNESIEMYNNKLSKNGNI